MSHPVLWTRFCALAPLFAAGLLTAQVMSVGSADGTIKDPSGSPLAGARVVLANVETNQIQEKLTNEIGYFVFPLVQPGRYSVTAEFHGFKKSGEALSVSAGRRSTADLTMQIGDVTESIDVRAQAETLETSTAGLSASVQRNTIQNLPLLGRNPLVLTNLTPGITSNAATNTTTGLTDVDSVSYTSSTGSNSTQNEFLLDGIPNNISDRVAFIPSVDSLEEFTVQTNALDAEYGHGGGMYVNMITKSGTNEFHGSVYEFFRNDKLNANSFFSNRNGEPRPPFHFNQYGVATGGPAVKDKLFWFFNWESFRQRSPYTYSGTAPTALQRGGDFSQTRDQSGSLFQIADPLTTQLDASGNQTRTLFPGGRIPASRLDPIALAVMKNMPAPSGPGNPITGTNNFFQTYASKFDGDNYSVRIDPYFKNHRFFGRWSFNQGFPGTPSATDIGGGIGDLEGNNRAQTSIGLSDVITLSPTMVLTAQAGFTRWTQEGVHPTFDPTTLGFSPSLVDQMTMRLYPRFDNSDMMSIGAVEGRWFEHTMTYSFNVGASKYAGRHNMKWGVQGQIKENHSQDAPAGGNYSFNRGFTQVNALSGASNSGSGIASFLLGYANSGDIQVPAADATTAPYYGLYFQDDFKVSQKLTLNLGLRYEIVLGTTDRYDRSVIKFAADQASPIQSAAQAAYALNPIPELPAADFKVLGGMIFASKDHRGNVNVDKGSWSPRIGLAYRLLPRTVLRTGFGTFYSMWWAPFVRQTGFSSDTNMITTLDGGLTPHDSLGNPFPNGIIQPTGSSLGFATALGQGLGGMYDYDRLNQRNFRWNFGLQQDIGKGITVEMSYVGEHGTRLPLSNSDSSIERAYNALDQKYYALGGTRLNTPIANPFYGLIPQPSSLAGETITIAQLLAPFPQFQSFRLQRDTRGTSMYHSLQTTINKRLNAGLSFQFAYTWSRQMETLRLIEPSDPKPSKMVGEFDNPQRVSLGATYELPFGQARKFRTNIKALDKVIGGWQWSTMYVYQTGQAVWLPAAAATGISPEIGNQTIDRWFNTDALAVLPSYTARRLPFMWNGLRQAPINNCDMSFLKDTYVYRERIKMQFRFEMINAFNRTWFGSPNVDPSSGSYGTVTSQANNPRNIQLGLKFLF